MTPPEHKQQQTSRSMVIQGIFFLSSSNRRVNLCPCLTADDHYKVCRVCKCDQFDVHIVVPERDGKGIQPTQLVVRERQRDVLSAKQVRQFSQIHCLLQRLFVNHQYVLH